MRCLKVCCIFSVMLLILSSPAFASYDVSSDTVYVPFEEGVSYNIFTDSVTVVNEGEEEEEGFPTLYAAGSGLDIVIGNDPPADPLFYGSGWITGTDTALGEITLYFPISYREGYWGLDANGYLYNVSSSSLSGYLADVYNNSVSAPAFSYPRYRESSGSSYNYIDLRFTPSDSNMQIATEVAPLYTMDDFMPYIVVFLGGVLILCFMKR